MKRLIKKLLSKLGLYHQIDYCSVDYLRSQGVSIGDNVDIINSQIDGDHGFLISIGNNVTITNAMLLSHDASTKKALGYTKVGRIDIGNDVFIGAKSVILPNVRIGNKVIIGAGTIITRDIPDNSVVVGNPCQVVCSYDRYIEKHSRNMETAPIYHTYAPDKTDTEKDQMKQELLGKIGYDL